MVNGKSRAAQQYMNPPKIDFLIAGATLTEGDKRLLALLSTALGIRHPAIKDLMNLVLRAQPKKEQQ